MKAVYCERYGTPEDLVLRDVPEPPPPGPGEVKVALATRGVSFADTLIIAGEYQVRHEPPFVVGGEGAGTVLEVGAGVEGIAPGDRVLAPGGCVEQVVVPAEHTRRLPETVDLDAAAAFRGNYATAYYGMQRGRLAGDEVLLVHGAAGGVGLAAVDVGKLMGATVIATASTEEKREVARRMGADHVLDYTQGFREEVKALTGGRGADVIYDPVGGEVFEESMRCIAPFGRILVVGFTSGRAALAKTNHLLVKDAEVIGFTVGALERHDPAWAARVQRVIFGWLAAGRIHPHVSHRLPLERTSEALRLILRREVIGKAVITS